MAETLKMKSLAVFRSRDKISLGFECGKISRPCLNQACESGMSDVWETEGKMN